MIDIDEDISAVDKVCVRYSLVQSYRLPKEEWWFYWARNPQEYKYQT